MKGQWTPQEKEIVFSRKEKGDSTKDMARALGRSHEAVRALLVREGKWRKIRVETCDVIRDRLLAGVPTGAVAREVGIGVESVKKVLTRIGREAISRSVAAQEEIEEARETIRKRIPYPSRGLLLFDPHMPHLYAPAMDAAMQAPGPFQWAVIGGDIMDQYMYSRFRHPEDGRIADELKAYTLFEKHVLDRVGKKGTVVKIMGNHDLRLKKLMESEMDSLADRLERPVAQKLRAATKEAYEYYYASADPRSVVHYDWWVAVGNPDVPNIIAHPDRYGTVHLATAKALRNYFINRKVPHQSLSIGHLHRCAGYVYDLGVFVAEMPAMCKRQTYMNESKAYAGALHTGFGILELDKQGNFVPLRANGSGSAPFLVEAI